ncbi:MAG: hypothetical protein KDB23_33475, partial [Planctomycetales bacterium]|nr:hypothetical protein [Planctomycetales bacterium]
MLAGEYLVNNVSYIAPNLLWIAASAPSHLHARRNELQARQLTAESGQLPAQHASAPAPASDTEPAANDLVGWSDRIVAAGLDASVSAESADAAELSVRMRPLRELWQMRGPGYLTYLMKQSPPNMATQLFGGEKPAVIPCVGLLPIQGGGGYVSQTHRGIAMEWLLTNTDDVLSETLRLAWLLTHLAVLNATAAEANAVRSGDRLSQQVATILSPLQTWTLADQD